METGTRTQGEMMLLMGKIPGVSRIARLLVVGVALAAVSCDEGLTTVPPLVVDVVEVAPLSPVLMVGDTVRLTAYPKTADGLVLGSVAIEWETDAPAVAELSGTGHTVLVRAVAEGTTRVFAASEGREGSVLVTVEAPEPEPEAPAVATVVVSPDTVALEAGGHAQLDVVLLAANDSVLEGRSVAWSSGTPGVATVSAMGEVTAVAAGTATIVATSEGVTGAAVVVVTEPEPSPAPVAMVWLGAYPIHSWVGQERLIQARVLDSSGRELEGRAVAWSVLDGTVATVDSLGEVSAVGPGVTRVLAMSEGVTGYVEIRSYAVPGELLDLAFVRAVNDTTSLVQTGVDTTWVDAGGDTVPATLLVTSGRLLVDRSAPAITYRQTLVWETWVTGSAGGSVVATSEYVDEGTAEEYYNVFTGELMYAFTSTTTTDLTFDGQFIRPGEFRLEQSVESIETLWYTFELE